MFERGDNMNEVIKYDVDICDLDEYNGCVRIRSVADLSLFLDWWVPQAIDFHLPANERREEIQRVIDAFENFGEHTVAKPWFDGTKAYSEIDYEEWPYILFPTNYLTLSKGGFDEKMSTLCEERNRKYMESIKMKIERFCASCTNRKTCAIDEGFREDCSYNGTSIPTLWEMDKTVKQEEKPSPREEILQEAIKCVCTDRNQQYGEPEDSFRMIGDLWGRYIEEKCLDVCTDENSGACCHVEILPEDVALLMVLFKVCRGATGEKITKDTLVDIAGYAACAGGMIENE